MLFESVFRSIYSTINDRWHLQSHLFLTFGRKILMNKYDKMLLPTATNSIQNAFLLKLSFFYFNFLVVLRFPNKIFVWGNKLFILVFVVFFFMYFIACAACTDTNEHTNKKENTTFQFRMSVHKAIKNRIAVARYCWVHTFTICNGRNVWQCRQHKIDYWLNINNLRVFVASLLLFRFHCKISSAHPGNGRLWISSAIATHEQPRYQP